jgi:transcriptional regulator of met regulon
MKSLPPFSSKDFLQEPFIELSYALNHAANVRFRLTKINSPCALERNPYTIEEHSTQCHDISTVINELKLEVKDILHPDLHVVNRPASSVQHVTTDSDTLCEALLENFIRENLSDNEVKPIAGSS